MASVSNLAFVFHAPHSIRYGARTQTAAISTRYTAAMEASLLGQVRTNLSRLADDPADVQALTALRAVFATCLASSDRDVAQLGRSVVYLLERLVDGTVAANDHSTALLDDAGAALAEDASTDCLELVERLDAFASGLGVVAVDADAAKVDDQEPPLLTVREDGTKVVPGAFGADPSGIAADATEALSALPEDESPEAIAAALAAASERLQTQLGTLDLLAGAELRRLAADLAATARHIERLQQALADWTRRNAA